MNRSCFFMYVCVTTATHRNPLDGVSLLGTLKIGHRCGREERLGRKEGGGGVGLPGIQHQQLLGTSENQANWGFLYYPLVQHLTIIYSLVVCRVALILTQEGLV